MPDNEDSKVISMPWVHNHEAPKDEDKVTVDMVLKQAMDMNLNQCIVLGRTEHGRCFVLFTQDDIEMVIGALEVAKTSLIDKIMTYHDEDFE